MKYKGFEIKRINRQGCVNCIVPELTRQGERHEIACNLKMAKKWVDLHLYDKYVNMGGK